jgi:C_GCAxxG_C_C family probable redox protein
MLKFRQEARIMSKADVAISLFGKGYSCSQAVFGAFAEGLGMDIATAMKVSDGFRGGMCMTDVCGAFSGGLMAIGLKYGRTEAGDPEGKKRSGEVIAEYTKLFKEKTGEKLTCNDLLGCDMRTDEGKAKMKEESLRINVCTELVRTTAGILEDMGI